MTFKTLMIAGAALIALSACARDNHGTVDTAAIAAAEQDKAAMQAAVAAKKAKGDGHDGAHETGHGEAHGENHEGDHEGDHAASSSAEGVGAQARVKIGAGDQIIDLALTDAMIRRPIAGRDVTAGFLRFDNTGTLDDALVSVRVEGAETVELHDMVMNGEMMAMRKVDAVPLPAGETVALKPGGMHLMLFGFAPAAEAVTAQATLTFASGPVITLDMPLVDIATLDATFPDEHSEDHSGHH